MAKFQTGLLLIFGMLFVMILSFNTFTSPVSGPLTRSGADILNDEHVVANNSLRDTAHLSIDLSQTEICHPPCMPAVTPLPSECVEPNTAGDYSPLSHFAIIPFLPSGLKRPPRLNVSS